MFDLRKISKIYKNYKALALTIISLLLIILPALLVFNYVMDIAAKLKSYPYIGTDNAFKNTINVSGEGSVYTKPDIVVVNLSVVTEGANIESVQEQNTKNTNNVIDFLKDFGVNEKDIKTKEYRLYPKYNYEDRNIPQIIGYEINQTIEAKIRDMEKIGEILEKSVSAGVNQINSLSFKVDNDEEFKNQARSLAVDNAKEKAKILASELGIKLNKIVGFIENSNFDFVDYKELGLGGGSIVPQIEAGENEIYVQVTLIYEIN